MLSDQVGNPREVQRHCFPGLAEQQRMQATADLRDLEQSRTTVRRS
jgi:hypothetical protein